MQTSTIKSYPFKQYQDDPDIVSFFDAYNAMTQQYVDLANSLNLPIYTGLTGNLLDWVGAGLYGFPRPTIGNPSGAVYGTAIYGQEKYGTGLVGAITLNDDYYKRVLTWKLHRGDGRYMSIQWLKRRIKRFLIGINGTSPVIDHTHEISLSWTTGNAIEIIVNYPSDTASILILISCINAKLLDIPWQYTFSVRSA